MRVKYKDWPKEKKKIRRTFLQESSNFYPASKLRRNTFIEIMEMNVLLFVFGKKGLFLIRTIGLFAN